MLKLPKTLLVTFILFFLILSLLYLVLLYYSMNSIEVFKYFHNFFLSLLLSAIFYTICCNKYFYKKNKIDFLMNNILTTIFILIYLVLIFSFFIIALVKYGFGIKIVIYWQISSFVLFFLAIGLFIKNHLKILKNKKIIKF